MFSSLLSFLFAASSITTADLPPSQVETIAEEVISELALSTPVAPQLIVMKRAEPTPLGAIRYSSGKCKLVININEQAWAQWSRFLNDKNKNDWNNIIRASVAHEVGHCMPEHSINLTGIELDEATMNALSRIDHEHHGRGQHILRQELFADTVAVLYAKEFLPETEAQAVLTAMIAARDNFGHNDPLHDTSRELRELVAQGAMRQPDETFGQAAVRLLGH